MYLNVKFYIGITALRSLEYQSWAQKNDENEKF